MIRYAGIFSKYLLIVFFVLIVIFVVSLNVFAYAFKGPDSALESYFNDLNTEFEIKRIPFRSDEIRFVQTGLKTDTVALLLFIHGAPGNLDNFKAYLADFDLKSSFKLISMDRPGYGGSMTTDDITDLSVQAEAAARVLELFNNKIKIVISHSYGGPVSGKLAADYPHLVDGLIMCAPLNDPQSEPMHWYSRLADLNLVRMMMPSFVEVATDEKITHSEELKKIEEDWQKIQIPVMHIHGKRDGLAPFEENIVFSRKNINEEYLMIEQKSDMGHLLIWMKAGFIKNKILEFVSEVSSTSS